MLIASRFVCKTNAKIDTVLFIMTVPRLYNRRVYDIVSDTDCVLRPCTWFRRTVRCARTRPSNCNRWARLTARTSDFGFPFRDDLRYLLDLLQNNLWDLLASIIQYKDTEKTLIVNLRLEILFLAEGSSCIDLNEIKHIYLYISWFVFSNKNYKHIS